MLKGTTNENLILLSPEELVRGFGSADCRYEARAVLNTVMP
jgi:hypothetical protein